MRDLIKVGDIIECILDLNQGSFEVNIFISNDLFSFQIIYFFCKIYNFF
jgi:hypothetical protein